MRRIAWIYLRDLDAPGVYGTGWQISGTARKESFEAQEGRLLYSPSHCHGWATLHSGAAAEEVVEGAGITRRAFAYEVAGDRWPDPARQLVPSRGREASTLFLS